MQDPNPDKEEKLTRRKRSGGSPLLRLDTYPRSALWKPAANSWRIASSAPVLPLQYFRAVNAVHMAISFTMEEMASPALWMILFPLRESMISGSCNYHRLCRGLDTKCCAQQTEVDYVSTACCFSTWLTSWYS